MAAMIELYYEKPEDARKEDLAIKICAEHGGILTYKETVATNTFCLTFEFDEWDAAAAAAEEIRCAQEHIEGPYSY